jgi:hypothetical protein
VIRDGSLLVVDDGGNKVWRITYTAGSSLMREVKHESNSAVFENLKRDGRQRLHPLHHGRRSGSGDD